MFHCNGECLPTHKKESLMIKSHNIKIFPEGNNRAVRCIITQEVIPRGAPTVSLIGLGLTATASYDGFVMFAQGINPDFVLDDSIRAQRIFVAPGISLKRVRGGYKLNIKRLARTAPSKTIEMFLGYVNPRDPIVTKIEKVRHDK